MKTIKDAVIEVSGKWPSGVGRFLKARGPANVLDTDFDFGCMSNSSSDYWIYLCTREEFESTAKRMGYIKGYEWGKEHATNGKRPELPDDVLIEVRYSKDGMWFDKTVGVSKWLVGGVVSFRITDPRHKPADEVSSNALSQDQTLTHSEEGLTHSDWHERGELPPVGVECEVCSTYNGWVNCKMLAHGICCENGKVAFWQAEHDCGVFYSENRFRPIKTHREKVIEEAMIVANEAKPECDITFLSALYNAGMLVLQQDSGNTKD